MNYPFLKGHGTENDFVLLPDHDGTEHGDLDSARVVALCDRRAGIGGDGVLRVIRTAAYDVLPCSQGARGQAEGELGAEWFMDYRNSDGSLSEMCGNGIRVFARHLVEEGLADPSAPISIGTCDGVKLLTIDGELVTADMGTPRVLGDTKVAVGARSWPATHVDLGNPHAVAFVDDLADAGSLLEAPTYDPALYPTGVNVEFVVRRGERHVAMRVHERGSGETRSCGTGAGAVMVAATLADGLTDGPADGLSNGTGGPPAEDVAYRVDVPGGSLTVTWTAGDRILLTGPAVIVARGVTDL